MECKFLFRRVEKGVKFGRERKNKTGKQEGRIIKDGEEGLCIRWGQGIIYHFEIIQFQKFYVKKCMFNIRVYS